MNYMLYNTHFHQILLLCLKAYYIYIQIEYIAFTYNYTLIYKNKLLHNQGPSKSI